MVRRFTGRLGRAAWAGLDERRDLPFVIGNSNFRHTEFLLERYGDALDPAALRQAFCEALLWTLASVPDVQRRCDVARSAHLCGLGELLADPEFQRLVRGGVTADNAGRLVTPLVARWGPAFVCAQPSQRVSAALDVYYMRYHSILQEIERGAGQRLSRELLGEQGGRLIEPMPGYSAFVALLKGWLAPEDAEALFEPLHDQLQPAASGVRPAGAEPGPARLARLARRFQRSPAKLALVTASSEYEARAVMREVLRVTAEEVQGWPLAAARRGRLLERLASERTVFDGFVNASDAHEARLKPHRDLYSIALFQMSIPRSEYACCMGLEDTEPGIVALRAAGVGCAIALPNRDTHRQDYRAAARVLAGGLPELLLVHNLMLTDEAEPAGPE
jgi:beta-phosphoglucomutase-like phosphatase (HAD superfamily)